MTKQDVFNAAVAEYDQMIAFLRTSATEIKKVVPGYSEETLLKNFDAVLQALLLKVGFADQELDSWEIQFITKVTDHVNILGDNFQLGSTEQAQAKRFFDQKADEILSQAGKVFEPIAAVDVCIPELDFYKFICDRIVNILAIFSHIDGNSSESEKQVALNNFTRFIAEPYQAVKSAVARSLRR